MKTADGKVLPRDLMKDGPRQQIKDLCKMHGCLAVLQVILQVEEEEAKQMHEGAIIHEYLVPLRKCVEEMDVAHLGRFIGGMQAVQAMDQAKAAAKPARRKSRKEAIAEEAGCDIEDVSAYQPGRSRPQIYTIGDDYYVAIRGKEKLPFPDNYEWQHVKDNGTYKIYICKV